MADELQPGQLVSVSAPRNNFELAPRARNFVLVADGIGITRILSMMRHLKNTDARDKFELYYLIRDAQCTAFLEELNSEFPRGRSRSTTTTATANRRSTSGRYSRSPPTRISTAADRKG